MLMACQRPTLPWTLQLCETTYLILLLLNYANKFMFFLKLVWFEFSTTVTKWLLIPAFKSNFKNNTHKIIHTNTQCWVWLTGSASMQIYYCVIFKILSKLHLAQHQEATVALVVTYNLFYSFSQYSKLYCLDFFKKKQALSI